MELGHHSLGDSVTAPTLLEEAVYGVQLTTNTAKATAHMAAHTPFA